jgi:hypothetical protein
VGVLAGSGAGATLGTSFLREELQETPTSRNPGVATNPLTAAPIRRLFVRYHRFTELKGYLLKISAASNLLA